MLIGGDDFGRAVFPLSAVCESGLMWTVRVTSANPGEDNSGVLLSKAKDMRHKKGDKYLTFELQ